jgi:hypothetical protein
LVCLTILAFSVKPAFAQHGDWLLGTNGLQSARHAPEGIFDAVLRQITDVSGSGYQ